MLEHFLQSLVDQGRAQFPDDSDKACDWTRQALNDFLSAQEEMTPDLIESYQQALEVLLNK